MDRPHTASPTFASLAAKRYSRRAILTGMGRLGLLAAVTASLPSYARRALAGTALSPLTFTEIEKSRSIDSTVAPGYDAQLLLRWGDRVLPGAPLFDPQMQTPQSQAMQFGYNNDFLAFLPFPRGSGASDHGLLFVNHEYTDARLMVPGNRYRDDEGGHSRREVDIEMAAHGNSIVEIRRHEGLWEAVEGSPYNRRITVETPVRISGPAAGDARLQTSYDPTGKLSRGTFANCSGGVTPWNTALSSEENFDGFFSGQPSGADAKNQRRYDLGGHCYYNWHAYHDRFDLAKEPNEPNRFGWVVEHDPFDPESMPVKRTALGRFKHEGAEPALCPDGRVAVYMGDDEKFEYLYRFVSEKPWNSGSDLLDSGVLSVAVFHENGSLEWRDLVHGRGPLTKENGFASQADVLIETRRAADLLMATPMDRPEGVKVSPRTGKVYVVLTKNADRAPDQLNPANPRARNIHGHIVELTPPARDGKPDHAARRYRWDLFLEGGDPAKPEDRAMYRTAPSAQGWLSCPDNIAFDPAGRLWIATDGQPASIGFNDGLYAAETEGPASGAPRLFFNGPTGCEITGPCFTPDGATLFLSIQHPGEDKGSNYDHPSTGWPDFREGMPPRPSVIAIVKRDGGPVGG